MRALTIICFLAINVLAADNPDGDWKRHPSVEEEYNTSKCVFVGEVVRARQVIDSDGFIQGTFYIVRIEELLKGAPAKQMEIYDENSSGRFPMRVGVRYVLFAYEGVFEGVEAMHLAVDSWGNSSTVQQAAKVLVMVRKLSKPKVQPIRPFRLRRPRGN